jgi:hypothetical protein
MRFISRHQIGGCEDQAGRCSFGDDSVNDGSCWNPPLAGFSISSTFKFPWLQTNSISKPSVSCRCTSG